MQINKWFGNIDFLEKDEFFELIKKIDNKATQDEVNHIFIALDENTNSKIEI